jgi:hypothetical protein
VTTNPIAAEVILSFDDSMTQQQVTDLYMESVRTVPGHVYRIIDLRCAPLLASSIVLTLGMLAQELVSAGEIPELAMAFVGKPVAVLPYLQFFDTLDNAQAYALAQLNGRSGEEFGNFSHILYFFSQRSPVPSRKSENHRGEHIMAVHSEPILVTTFYDSMDERKVIELYMESVELAKAVNGPVYRVIDLRNAPQSAGRIIATLGEMARGLTGAAVVPNLAMVFVGHAVQSVYQSFETLEAALDYAREQVAEPVR